MPLVANTTEEAGQYIGLRCHVDGSLGAGSPTGVDFSGTIIAWADYEHHKFNQWLVYSKKLAKDGRGHAGKNSNIVIGDPIPNTNKGHWFCDSEQITLLNEVKVRGNELYMEEYDASSADQD